MPNFTNPIDLHVSDKEPGDYARLYIRGSTFDMSTKYGKMYGNACADITPDDAAAIIAALQAAFNIRHAPATTEPDPDISLPDVIPTPACVTVELDGAVLTLTNWLDFRGWEVRRRNGVGKASAPGTLGWVRSLPVWAVRRAGDEEVKFERVDAALRWLVAAE